MYNRTNFLTIFLLGFMMTITTVKAEDSELGTEGYAQSGDVKIHYVTKGSGPLVVMIHGFPDFWYTWRNQIPELSKNYQVVAIDQRGYNKSDQPEGVENYAMPKLVADVAAVIKHFGKEKAIIVGHDWGGAVAWSFAMMKPEMTDKLIVLNLPHLYGLQRELANNPDQEKASAYARRFQEPDAAASLNAQFLTFWVKDPSAKQKYVEAFERSSIEGMLNYYKANYPRPPYQNPEGEPVKVKCPVLLIHGLDDTALLPGALNDTWEWLEQDLTLVTIPGADHFVQHAAADKVTRTILAWLQM
jgi:pimeloyl-ACP methyl ester carboxylesterase